MAHLLLVLSILMSGSCPAGAGAPAHNSNPIGTTSVSELVSDPLVTSCAHLNLESHEAKLIAEIANRCDDPIAVLQAPFEVRTRQHKDPTLSHEVMLGAVYGIVYLLAEEQPFHESFGYGDAALQVFGLPEYFVVPPGTSLSVEIDGMDSLSIPTGKYTAVVRTIAAICQKPCEGSSLTGIDVGDGVVQHNRRHEGRPRVFLGPNARFISSSPDGVQIAIE